MSEADANDEFILNSKPAIPNKFLNADGTYSTLGDIMSEMIDTELFIIVDELPSEGDLQKIYLLPDGEGGFIEYRWTGTKWDKIGVADIDLSNYSTKQEMEVMINTSDTAILDSSKSYTDSVIAQYIGTARLPNVYQEVEYIKSTGTQYIDTGFYPRATNTNIIVENKFNKSVLSGYQCILGARTDTTGYLGMMLPSFIRNEIRIQGIVPAQNIDGTYSINTDYVFKAELNPDDAKNFYIDETLRKQVINKANKSDTGGNLYLFALNQDGANWFFNGKLYYCKIWQDDILVRDFVPCYRKSDDEIGMYDLVNAVFYTNDGTGSFIAGPKVN